MKITKRLTTCWIIPAVAYWFKELLLSSDSVRDALVLPQSTARLCGQVSTENSKSLLNKKTAQQSQEGQTNRRNNIINLSLSTSTIVSSYLLKFPLVCAAGSFNVNILHYVFAAAFIHWIWTWLQLLDWQRHWNNNFRISVSAETLVKQLKL